MEKTVKQTLCAALPSQIVICRRQRHAKTSSALSADRLQIVRVNQGTGSCLRAQGLCWRGQSDDADRAAPEKAAAAVQESLH